jgi:hypothetical protein
MFSRSLKGRPSGGKRAEAVHRRRLIRLFPFHFPDEMKPFASGRLRTVKTLRDLFPQKLSAAKNFCQPDPSLLQ